MKKETNLEKEAITHLSKIIEIIKSNWFSLKMTTDQSFDVEEARVFLEENNVDV